MFNNFREKEINSYINKEREKDIDFINNFNHNNINIYKYLNEQIINITKTQKLLKEIISFDDFITLKTKILRNFYDLELELREISQNINEIQIENNELKNENNYLVKKFSNLEQKYSICENFNKELKQKNKEIQLIISPVEENRKLNNLNNNNNKIEDKKYTIDFERDKKLDLKSKDFLFSPIVKNENISTDNDNDINNDYNDDNGNISKGIDIQENQKNLFRKNSININHNYNEMSIYPDNKSEYLEPIKQKNEQNNSNLIDLDKNTNINNNIYFNKEAKYKVLII
jgi:hypothetical protein